MPRLRENEIQKRERILREAVKTHAKEKNLKNGDQISEYIGIGISSFYKYQQNNYQNMNFDLACRMARKLGVTGKEWCAAAGIPYEKEED
ncbi:hypothetical protein [uncultured Mailhella sp.]|uniref:hypothetical protein n=1 Tax=uncultured Mailhella sp. TaxID=1981031 RepID=UPI00260E9FBD|nr:hypothetical protein [uncultured Mailhella sp.]